MPAGDKCGTAGVQTKIAPINIGAIFEDYLEFEICMPLKPQVNRLALICGLKLKNLSQRRES